MSVTRRAAVSAATMAGVLVLGSLASAGLSADGLFTKDQARRGQMRYSAECSQCHQDDLSGTDRAPALVGDMFTADWDGMTVRDLYTRVSKTMPPTNAGGLMPQEYLDIVAYLLQSNDYPAGTTELTPDDAALGALKITKDKQP